MPRLLALAAALLLAAGMAAADSFWMHNGSLMRLTAQGASRVFTYEDPRPGMRAEGVTRGTVLFEGRRDGDRYSGIARTFSRRCAAPMTYPMAGRVTSETRVVLEGMRPVFADCRPTGEMRYEQLVFDYVSTADSPAAAMSAGEARETAVALVARVFIELTLAEARASVVSVTRGGSGACAAPDRWIARVSLPRYGLSGDLGLNARSGALECSTLPID